MLVARPSYLPQSPKTTYVSKQIWKNNEKKLDDGKMGGSGDELERMRVGME